MFSISAITSDPSSYSYFGGSTGSTPSQKIRLMYLSRSLDETWISQHDDVLWLQLYIVHSPGSESFLDQGQSSGCRNKNRHTRGISLDVLKIVGLVEGKIRREAWYLGWNSEQLIYNYITLYIYNVSIDIHIYENPAHIPAIHGSSMTQERHLTVGKIHGVFGRWPTTSDCPWPSWKRDERRRCNPWDGPWVTRSNMAMEDHHLFFRIS
jgi:hypothetical protein